MAIAGAKPKEDRSQVRHRVPQAEGAEWTEVVDVPFEGGPALPDRPGSASTEDPHAGDATPVERGWPAWSLRWWEAVRAMPHCALWSPTDWEFAFAVAEAHARFVEGWKGCATGAELRIKEKALGTTADARRDLRIRYVKPRDPDEPLPANVVQGNFGEL